MSGCSATKSIPPGRHLMVKNVITVQGDKMKTAEISEIIKQQPNTRFLGMRVRLGLYNAIDSVKLVKHKIKKINRFRKKNNKRIQKEYRINTRRRDKAIKRGYPDYIYKKIKLKDTISDIQTWREKVKFKLGEAPVIADSTLLSKSRAQLKTYMHSKGYFYATVSADFDTLRKKLNKNKFKKKVRSNFTIQTGTRYFIGSVNMSCTNPGIKQDFLRFMRKEVDKGGLNSDFQKSIVDNQLVKIPFDADKLDAYRSELATYLRNQSYYGFVQENISYKADTSARNGLMNLTVLFTDRAIQDKNRPDSVYFVPHQSTKIENVYFHIADTSRYKGNFRNDMRALGLEVKNNNFVITRDTMVYKKLLKKVEDYAESAKLGHKVILKSVVNKTLLGKMKDSIDFDPFRIATFFYNQQLFVSPKLIEAQNYLENKNYYKEYYLERSFARLVQLNLFSVIKPEIIEKEPGSGLVEMHYYLVPAMKQSFSFEPRAKNSNGFLGVSASLNYNNRNIFRSGTNFTFSISGGFESNPGVFTTNDKGKKIKTQGRSFNTIEVGPSLKLDIPGLFPFGVTILGKRQRPRTELSAAYNYQNRPEFERGSFQFNYLYRFMVGDGKTQSFSFGLPGMSVVKYVFISPKGDFDQKINLLNDLFLKNAYRNQFVWEDFKLAFDFDNLDKKRKISNKLRIQYGFSFSIAGNLVNAITSANPKYDPSGHKTLFGVPFSQFTLFDNKLIAYYEPKKNHTLAFRTMAGVGFPMKNSPLTLPYDYSFFGGGANDNRGWAARSLGPGSYEALLDPNKVATQIGDVRFNASLEYRVSTGGFFAHALFIDAGNIWTMKNDPNRIGGQISPRFLRELAVSFGYGLRFDFKYFIFRLDLGMPIYNPTFPEKERLIFSKKTEFYQKAEAVYGSDYKNYLPNLFIPRLNFGIGFPF